MQGPDVSLWDEKPSEAFEEQSDNWLLESGRALCGEQETFKETAGAPRRGTEAAVRRVESYGGRTPFKETKCRLNPLGFK